MDAALVSHGRFQVEEGIDQAGRLLTSADPPTAIVTGNDLQALGVYQAARELRLHIPEDVSVVGFDDLPVARWVGPPLTTIRQPLVAMAETAAEMVLFLAAASFRASRASSCRPNSSCARARPHRRRPCLLRHRLFLRVGFQRQKDSG